MQRFTASRTASRGFKTFTASWFKAGDSIPAHLPGLQEGSPGNKIDIANEVAKGKSIIVGVPAAFSPACSASHVPGYVNHWDELKAKGVQRVLVTPVNDAFAAKAWGESLRLPKGIRVVADSQGAFAKAGGHLFDSEPIFGNKRSIRYAAIVQDGKVVQEFDEPDKTGVDVSSAENVLKHL